MTDQQTRAYRHLSDLLLESNDILQAGRYDPKLDTWNFAVRTALARLFGMTTGHLNRFIKVSYDPWSPYDEPNFSDEDIAITFEHGILEARAIIGGVLDEYRRYEMPNAVPPATNHIVMTPDKPANREVFVVHGHDEEMKQSVARFLERLELKPIILHEQPNRGATVIEKFEHNADVGFAVVLLSPDDQGRAQSTIEELPVRGRARQNVVLELGYFIGRLGRERVCPIVRGDLEEPSDIHGVVYLRYDDASWKNGLVMELKAAGLEIDANILF